VPAAGLSSCPPAHQTAQRRCGDSERDYDRGAFDLRSPAARYDTKTELTGRLLPLQDAERTWKPPPPAEIRAHAQGSRRPKLINGGLQILRLVFPYGIQVS